MNQLSEEKSSWFINYAEKELRVVLVEVIIEKEIQKWLENK